MKYLSFSLWGDKPIYTIGAIKNSELWKEIYSDWQMVVFHDCSVPKDIIEELNENSVLTKDVSDRKLYGMFWRFLAVDLPDSEYCIFRDSDSRISLREKLAVDEWLASGKSLHVMRDHPAHMIPYGSNNLGILGGMWGIKSKYLPLVQLIENYHTVTNNLSYGSDQNFLIDIFEFSKDDKVTHDEFFEKIPFPIPRLPGRFVGERIDENDKPVGQDYKLVL